LLSRRFKLSASLYYYKVTTMAKEQVEYSWLEYLIIQNLCLITVFCLCDIDNNWVLLLFTSCALLTLYVDLVGGMGTGEADPSQI